MKTETTGLDLMSAKELASKMSKRKKRAYIQIDSEGECSVSLEPSHLDEYAFFNGTEIPLEEDVEKVSPNKSNVQQLNTNTMSTKKAKTAKTAKPTKKAASKKVASKKVAVKSAPEGTGKATTLVLTDSQWSKVEARCEKDGTNIRSMVREAMIKTYSL